MKSLCFLIVCLLVASTCAADLTPVHLRCEYLENPIGIDITKPRLSWRLVSDARGQTQSAYRVLVASSSEKLASGEGDLWDSGKVDTSQSLFIEYEGEPLASRRHCFWKVQAFGADGSASWSQPASWSMGLLQDSEWQADYISYLDDSAIHTDTQRLFLPAARQYRKEFRAKKEIEQATIYATALGIYELHLNGKRVGDAMFSPGWTDYRQRAYYNTYDVTDMVGPGDNAVGAWVADGWYSGYVGFGLLTGMGTEKNGATPMEKRHR